MVDRLPVTLATGPLWPSTVARCAQLSHGSNETGHDVEGVLVMKVYLDDEPVPIWSTSTPIAALQGRGATNTLPELTMDGSVLLPGHHFLWVHTQCKSLPRNSPATPDEAKHGLQAGAALPIDAMSTDTAFFVVQPPRLSFSSLSHDSVTLHAYGAGPATSEACVWAFRPHTSAGGGCIPPLGGVRCTVLDSSVVQPRVVVRPRLSSCVSPSGMVVVTIACECWLRVFVAGRRACTSRVHHQGTTVQVVLGAALSTAS